MEMAPSKRGQHDQQEADAVDSQRIVRADGGNPVVAFAELIARRADLEAPEQRQRNHQAQQAEEVADHAMQVVASRGNQQQHNRTDQRREQESQLRR